MKSGTNINQRDIILVPFPFSDLSNYKKRPVLIMSKDSEDFDDIIVCQITSKLNESRYSIYFDNKDMDQGEILSASLIKSNRLFTLDKKLVKKKIGTLKKGKYLKVVEKIIKQIK
ncbi:MAG: type II toxin-antitoxin system PemK/MazF family toxin [Nanoarchaeota archaeon]|nr:type II toxin-antitoxin system PemK/MazF family toxin [Nanoarchaeota archaeon]